MQKVKWVCELPESVQNEIRMDANKIIDDLGLTFPLDDITPDRESLIDHIMNEKLINIIGYEEGLLDADKYSKYVLGL